MQDRWWCWWIGAGLSLVLVLSGWSVVEAQTTPYIGASCILSWDKNTEPDIAGYRAFAVNGATQGPTVTITHPQTSTTCSALGVTTDGTWTFTVLAVDQAGNVSAPATLQAIRDTVAPAAPGGLKVGSAQPVAMAVTPNPLARETTVSWVPGTCRGEFVVHRLVSGKWVEIGRTTDTWLTVPLINSVNQPYAVSAVCP